MGEVGDAQNLEANLSTFSGHLMGLKPILEGAQEDSLVLLDELAVGTDPQTGQAIGVAVPEELANKQTVSVVTTHFDNLKALQKATTCLETAQWNFLKESSCNLQACTRYSWSKSYQSAENLGLPKMFSNERDRGQGSTSVDQLVENFKSDEKKLKKSKLNLKPKLNGGT